MDQSPTHNLPAQPTPFIGRTEELNELKNLLGNPDCRLLTLVGPGGSGKTRLAIEAATETAGDFADGVYFAPLQPVESIEFLVPAIADSIEFSLRGQEEPKVQLFNHLKDKHLLLVLDNFEHLVAAADLLGEMVSAAPKLKLVVTTREALNLRGEWVFPVPGMRFPEGTDIARLERYDAVRLFLENARHVKGRYSPEADVRSVFRHDERCGRRGSRRRGSGRCVLGVAWWPRVRSRLPGNLSGVGGRQLGLRNWRHGFPTFSYLPASAYFSHARLRFSRLRCRFLANVARAHSASASRPIRPMGTA